MIVGLYIKCVFGKECKNGRVLRISLFVRFLSVFGEFVLEIKFINYLICNNVFDLY